MDVLATCQARSRKAANLLTAMIRSAKRTIAARLAGTMAATVASLPRSASAVHPGDLGYDEIAPEEQTMIIGAP